MSSAVDGEGSSKGARAAGKAHSCALGFWLARVVRVRIARNAANPGWFGLQNTQSRHAAQPVEVVRNHENGTCRVRGSNLPKVVFIRDFECFGTRDSEGSWEWTHDGDVSGGALRERIP